MKLSNAVNIAAFRGAGFSLRHENQRYLCRSQIQTTNRGSKFAVSASFRTSHN
jgi:hypothetical protein